MSDLIERLRAQPEYAVLYDDSGDVSGLRKSMSHEAADEIERLTAEREAIDAAMGASNE